MERLKKPLQRKRQLCILLVLGQVYTNFYYKPVYADETKKSRDEDPTNKNSYSSKQHIDQGNTLLAAGQLNDALVHYNQAVELEPESYQARYRRATCLLALGRSKSAVPDLDKVINLEPSFWQARNQRAHVFLKQGKFDEALKDYENCKSYSKEARESISEVKTIRQHYENSKIYFNRGHYKHSLDSLKRIVEKVPWSHSIRRIMADCYENFNDLDQTINNLKPLIQLSPQSAPETYLRLAKIYYLKADITQSLEQIRECLKIDPDHKICFAFYKVAKKLNKQFDGANKLMAEEKFEESINKLDQTFGTTENHKDFNTPPSGALLSFLHLQKCKILEKANKMTEALDACSHAIENNQQDLELLMKRGKMYEDIEDWESALKDYKTVNSIDNRYNGIRKKIEKCEKMKKRAASRDYYKILGVGKRAKNKEINKAYKKLAKLYHPDRCGKNEETINWDEKKCETKFRDLADSKEVLSDPEKREMFDEGTDPLDAQEQADQNRSPFGHGFNPFGGGGGYRFHF